MCRVVDAQQGSRASSSSTSVSSFRVFVKIFFLETQGRVEVEDEKENSWKKKKVEKIWPYATKQHHEKKKKDNKKIKKTNKNKKNKNK